MGAKTSSPVSAIPPERTFIVTGANSGMGYHVAKVLAQLGGRVIVACRSEERALQAIEQMKKEYEEESAKQSKKPSGDVAEKSANDETKSDKPEDKNDTDKTGDVAKKSEGGAAVEQVEQETKSLNLEFMKLDLSKLASVMEFIKAFKEKGYPLHTLVCNAGIQSQKQEYTEDDFELHFQVSYLGHVLLILHLLPLLQQNGPNSRIVYTTTGAFSFKNGTKVVLDDIQGKTKYVGAVTMGNNAKLYQVMNMYAFERRMKEPHLGWFSVNPGTVHTPMVQSYVKGNPIYKYTFKAMESVGVAKTPRQGADVLLKAIVDASYDDKPAFFFDHKCGEKGVDPGPVARDVEKQEILWKYTLECLKDYINDDIMKGLNDPPEQTEEKEGAKGDKTDQSEQAGDKDGAKEDKKDESEQAEDKDGAKGDETAGAAAAPQ